MDFNQVADRVAGREGIIDAVVPLGHAVADVGCKIARRLTTRLLNALRSEVHQFKQMCRAGVAVPKGRFHEDLRFFQILFRPSHAHAQRIHLRRELSYILTSHCFHSCPASNAVLT